MSNTPKELEEILNQYFGAMLAFNIPPAVEAIQELLKQEYQRGFKDGRRDGIEDYGLHQPMCRIDPCNCGLLEALGLAKQGHKDNLEPLKGDE